MFTEFVKQILGAERHSVSNRLENAEPSVSVKKDSNEPIPEKYRKDIEALRKKYGDSFSTGFCIEVTLRELLELCPRDRRKTDAYIGLVSYLKNNYDITLTIKSQKKKL